MDEQFEPAMHRALMHLGQAKLDLGIAAWASPDTYDAIEHLRMSIDTLAKRIERERTRWERERNEN